VAGSGTATNTGEGWLFQSSVLFTGKITLNGCSTLFSKFGYRANGSAVTTISLFYCFAVGRPAGIVTGSAGFKTEIGANMVGSVWYGGTVESYDIGLELLAGGVGIGFSGDMEDNNTNFVTSAAFNGDIEINFNGIRRSKGTNASANVWWQDDRLNGFWRSESFLDRTHNILEGSGTTKSWGFTRGQSKIDALAEPRNKWMAVGGTSDITTPQNNYTQLLDGFKMSWSATAPTAGAWGRGSIVWDATPVAGGKAGRIVTDGGTFSSATDSTGDTTSGSNVITGLTDTSDFDVFDVVNISAGFAATSNIIILEKTSTTITVDVNSNSTQSNVTVDTQDPVFKLFGVIDA